MPHFDNLFVPAALILVTGYALLRLGLTRRKARRAQGTSERPRRPLGHLTPGGARRQESPLIATGRSSELERPFSSEPLELAPCPDCTVCVHRDPYQLLAHGYVRVDPSTAEPARFSVWRGAHDLVVLAPRYSRIPLRTELRADPVVTGRLCGRPYPVPSTGDGSAVHCGLPADHTGEHRGVSALV